MDFYRRFIPKFAQKTKALTVLTRKNMVSLQGLQDEIVAEPTLKLFNPEAETELHMDVSADGLAGMLQQKDKKGRLHLVQ